MGQRVQVSPKPVLGPRFLTDADMGGVEKLSITAPRAEYGMVSEHVLSASEITPDSPDLLDAHGLIFVKGWSRAISALTVMLCCFEQTEFLQAGFCGACGFTISVQFMPAASPTGMHFLSESEA